MAKKNETNSKPVVPTAAAPSTPATPAPTKRAVKPAATKSKTVAKTPKAPTSVKAKRTTKPKAPAAPSYTHEDVALRAYFIAEKRRSQGIHGDEHQDWLEAERQLLAESAKPAKKAKKA